MKLLKVAAVFTSALLMSAAAFGQSCPALSGTDATYVAAGAGCNLVISVGSGGALTITTPNGNPYDGSDDSYVGIINKSNQAVSSITLTDPGVDVFGFDGDGIGVSPYNAPTNPQDTSNGLYGGPDAYFSNILVDSSGNHYQGTVDFVTPLAANGGTTYFSLEESPSVINAGGPTGSTGPTGNAVTPEPGTLALLGTGALGLAGTLRRRLFS